MDPRELSFEQREGLEPLPSQLQRGEISDQLRAKLWEFVHDLMARQHHMLYNGIGEWSEILRSVHIDRLHYRADKFSPLLSFQQLGDLFAKGDYSRVYGWLDFVMRHPRTPHHFARSIGDILEKGRSAYRVIDGLIVPVASEEEGAAFEHALAEASQPQFTGARTHLKQAGTHLTAGNFADSIRESISAVESVARVLEPSGEFGKALAILEAKISIHPALKKGFSSIYGYTSDQGGIRHALLDSTTAAVDEVDAIFFLGACSSFVSYLVGKARTAGVI